jgi:Zn-dependent peptidase ImmA (M78 family)/DNA-binding XRE family transcriptional regulator
MSTAGVRIKQARQRRKLSQRALAEQVDVSHNAISKYERGINKPGSDVLLQIADALDVDVSFFLRPVRVDHIEPAYRKLSKLKKSSEYQLIERIRDWLERYLEAEAIVEPEPADFDMPSGFPWTVTSEGDAEAASLALREAWDLGTDPIEDMTSVLEDHGIRVGIIEADDGFDACTFRAEIDGGVPVIVTRQGLPGDRQRFNLAHELGHLLLKVNDDLDEEKACHRFAGALLAPEPAVREAAGGSERKNVTLDELHVLKHKFGISMQSLFFRLRDLGITSDASARNAHRTFRKRGWHLEEPGDPIDPEHPERFHLLVLRALGEDLIGERRARELYGGPIAELESQLQPAL